MNYFYYININEEYLPIVEITLRKGYGLRFETRGSIEGDIYYLDNSGAKMKIDSELAKQNGIYYIDNGVKVRMYCSP